MAVSVTDGIYNFPDHKSGTTYLGNQFTIIDEDSGLPIDITDALLKMQMRKNKACNTDVAKTFDNDINGGLTIINGAAGVFTFDRQLIDVIAGYYVYDIKITLEPDDEPFTWIQGAWTILESVTRN